MNQERKTSRCAIYTRKSTEHNLDLEFNSLDAQREACEAYIKSQMHEGWKLLPDHYDDGGISGASLDRPDLQRLLADIRAGKIDTIVVYKVDRLTRSLMDFAKLVELFDAHGVSFVSVTQSFNTTSSMGRLTLNVLLSFAQFEREVIGERVRDKIAASKRKGLGMGGSVPMGYLNQEKKLVVVPDEAETVRWIFRRYLELGAIGPLLQELDRVGVRTRVRKITGDRTIGGGRFGKGGLDHLLKNRCYVGEIEHRGENHAACHEPIVDRDLFEAVQAQLLANKVAKKSRLKSSPFLLAGLIFDSAGNRMSPSHSVKNGARYRYYVSQAVLQHRKEGAGEIARVPAPDIEMAIETFVRDRSIGMGGRPEEIGGHQPIEDHISKITVLVDTIKIELRAVAEDPRSEESKTDSETVTLSWSRKPYSVEKGIVSTPSLIDGIVPVAQDTILAAIGKARIWIDEIVAGGSFAEIAKQEGKGERQIRLLAPLAFVPPDIVRGLIDGTARAGTVTDLARNVPFVWPALVPTNVGGQRSGDGEVGRF